MACNHIELESLSDDYCYTAAPSKIPRSPRYLCILDSGVFVAVFVTSPTIPEHIPYGMQSCRARWGYLMSIAAYLHGGGL